MEVSHYNPHWDHLAGTGQMERLAGEIHLWRQNFLHSLRSFAERSSVEWAEVAHPLIEDLNALDPAELVQDWPEGRVRLSSLNQEGHIVREDYLQQRGPTPLPWLNSIVMQIELLAEKPEEVAGCGSVIFADLKSFEAWAGENGVHGAAYDQMRQWLEDLGLGLLARNFPEPARGRAEMLAMWERLAEEHNRQRSEEALAGPTQSARWNSWILLLELCELETQDHTPVLDSLDGLDADVEDLAATLGEDGELGEVVADYREASQQLRQALLQGKRLKGWSQILPPILIDLDRLVPREEQSQAPVNRVRALCQEFECGSLPTEQFQSRLAEFAASLVDSRKQSRIQAAQHPSEAAFLEALGKLQSGVEILQSVDRSGQASRLEMGCTLIEEGLSEIQRLESGDG
ncbi:MAG: hypothetical protein U0931_22270 [Vulcanimicrobiota bacterium]